MINTALTRKAMIIAYNAHMNQFDKAGVPYIYHPVHLAEQMDTEAACIAALLHDVAEDTEITIEELAIHFPEEVIEALKLLTHDDSEDYMKYVERLKSNPVARKVKLADLAHNSDLSRLDVVADKDLKRIEKYKNAIMLLERD